MEKLAHPRKSIDANVMVFTVNIHVISEGGTSTLPKLVGFFFFQSEFRNYTVGYSLYLFFPVLNILIKQNNAARHIIIQLPQWLVQTECQGSFCVVLYQDARRAGVCLGETPTQSYQQSRQECSILSACMCSPETELCGKPGRQ